MDCTRCTSIGDGKPVKVSEGFSWEGGLCDNCLAGLDDYLNPKWPDDD